MRPIVPRPRLLAAGAALLVPAALLLGVPQALAAPPALARVPSTMPRWLASGQARRDAAPAATGTLSVRVYLAPRGGQAALESAVGALSDPHSARYGQWLSADQYRAAYRPSDAALSRVRGYLTGQGLAVTGVEAQRRYVSARGTVAQLQRTFHVSLRRFSHDGQQVTAPTAAVQLPPTLAGSVLTVTGLDTTVAKMTNRQSGRSVTPPPAFANARPCSTYFGQLTATYQADYKTKLPKFGGKTLPYATCGYTGPQLRTAYEADSALTGKGVTVAITDAYRWQLIAKDASRYAAAHGDPAYAKGQLSESLPTSYRHEDECDPSGWSGEETLDVEAVHAMAPGARIRYYAARSCYDDDFSAVLARVVDENVATVVSNSWGDAGEQVGTDEIAAYQQVVLQGAAQGISFLFSSGDNGDELANTGFTSADFPASLPAVTAVGGTSTGIDWDGSKLFDTGWGTVKYTLSRDGRSWSSVGFTSGAGGGYSSLFNRPAYQQGVVPASAPAGRAVPDVAMDADPNTGMLVGQTQTFAKGVHYGEYRIGGTSLASPLFAGQTALAVQQRGGRRLGQLNPVLYASRSLFRDVRPEPSRVGVVRADYSDPTDAGSPVVYSVRRFGRDSSLATAAGWDPVTGLGVPKVSYLTGLKTPDPAVATAAR
ncbi:MAG: physarolisin [Friedmanniella sp.]|nr:physarolisin [Friedmanniella sp.]